MAAAFVPIYVPINITVKGAQQRTDTVIRRKYPDILQYVPINGGRGRMLVRMWQYHLRHHFISEKLWFGVSNPSFDILYRTYREPKSVEKSPTVRKLYS